MSRDTSTGASATVGGMAKPIPRLFKKNGRWHFRYTDEHGTRRKKSFAAHADAEYALADAMKHVKAVKRGLEAPTPPDKTFNEVCDYWETYRAPGKRDLTNDRSILKVHLRPFFGELLLRDITVQKVDQFRKLKARSEGDEGPDSGNVAGGADGRVGKKTLHNILTKLITLLALAVELNWLLKAPKIKKPKIRLFSQDYDYLKTKDEIARFLSAALAEGPLVFILYLTAVFTGLREGELAALTWADVDLEKRLIRVQQSFDGPTKAEDLRWVPILDPLLGPLKEWKLRCPSKKHLFPNRDGGMQGKSGRVFQEVLHRVLDAAGFPKTEIGGRVHRYIVFHDLRHTFASHWMMNGGDIFRLQKILGHKSIEMTMRYAHLSPSVFAEDFGRLGNAVVLDQCGTVVPLNEQMSPANPHTTVAESSSESSG